MKLLRTKQVIRITGLSRITIYRLERSGGFPKRQRIGRNAVAWLEEDIAALVGSRPFAHADLPGLDCAPGSSSFVTRCYE